ncbi:type IVB secretion system protein IcmH/DotU [Denitromonas iodatirespirans]|uniref:Type IVB secretion system protein IcmH/DotU n=1 Tax=Denitromonas iodatirespirans TaxID=2795389 RepID=A0A944DG87_DENI1|nr:type IVB secretion system protein IcmH/DotU [Denitromonas iodatirespirans]MBT0963778.1 type IVB secretion system protein IcmH/DotU [Denitromonas iodatirespirans]
MNSPPTLFADTPAPRKSAPETNARSLVDLLYDGFYMLILLRNQTAPSDADTFTTQIQKFLDHFERTAKKHHFNSEDVFDAKYAFCAAVDETILSSRSTIRDAWERRPLQLALFGDQLAGEHFFDKLETARNGGAGRLNALEVFHMCLLLGFKGKYLLEGPEKLKYLTAQLGEHIAHLKGKAATFAPRAMPPDQVVHVLKREIPVWALASVLSLFGLLAFIGLNHYAETTVDATLAPFQEIVQLAPRAPTLTITLP